MIMDKNYVWVVYDGNYKGAPIDRIFQYEEDAKEYAELKNIEMDCEMKDWYHAEYYELF